MFSKQLYKGLNIYILININMTITHIYIIGNETKEPERVSYLKEYFKSENNVTFFQPTYKDTITDAEMKKYVPINESLHNRPLRMSEISIFLNFIYLFEKILSTYSEGYFLVLESDVLFVRDHKDYLEAILKDIKTYNIDCTSIGFGCNLVPPRVNIESNTLQYARMTQVRCCDSMIFSYSGIKKVYNYIQIFLKSGKSLNQPIDNFLQTYFENNLDYIYVWAWPPLCIQGSQNGKYKSNVQDV
jgi:GR25 family glycosyltransferase involved in LPS biosynthesis